MTGFEEKAWGPDSHGEYEGHYGSPRDEDYSRRAEEFRQAASDLSRELRRLVGDFQSQVMVFAEDLRGRGRPTEGFSSSPIEKIRALAELRDEGLISEEEFQEQKKRLLGQI